ncbi:MAG: sigma-70 family RNA polymerase sigma factor [Firmicutes bacterium]|nr:sigma-70 family RNA polymerase sigma factor [Bacillota bacterium]
MEAGLGTDISRIKEDRRLRDSFLESHREFVRRYASFVSHRPLNWENDDELSVGLIALNDAIDSYDPRAGVGFLSYAKVLIRRRLIDQFRKSAALDVEGPLEDDMRVAARTAPDDEERLERAYEMSCFEQRMAEFGITLNDLVRNSPSHRPTRQTLMQVALAAYRCPEIVQRLRTTGQLPLKEIQMITGCSRKVLETWRKYLISLIVILTEDELEGTREFIFG